MEDFKKYITEALLGAAAILASWTFKAIHGRVKALETEVVKNKQAIALNTQADKDYRERVDAALIRIEGVAIETRDLMTEFNAEYSFVLKKLSDKEMKK